jgi:hypothetical protein
VVATGTITAAAAPTVWRALTANEMASIARAIDSAPGPEGALLAAVKTTLNALLGDIGEKYDMRSSTNDPHGSDCAIPDEQWHEIAAHLMERGRSVSDDVGLLMVVKWRYLGPCRARHHHPRRGCRCGS